MNKRTFAVLLACFLTVLVAYSIRFSYGALLPEMLPALDITKTQAGVIFSAYFIAYTLISPVLGVMADRFNQRILLAVFVAIMGAGTFLMQFATSVIQASVFFTIAGIGCAACWAPVMALALRWINDKKRGLTLAMIDAGSSLGLIAAGSLVPLAVAESSWKVGWMWLGIMGLGMGVINFILIRDPFLPINKNSVSPQSKAENPPLSYQQIIRDRRFWITGIAYLLTGFAVIIPFTFLSTFAVQELDYSYTSAAFLISFIGFGGMAGKLTLGPFSDKFGRIKVLVLCAFLIAAGSLAMVFPQRWLLTVACFVFGIGYGACWALYAACASDFFSKSVTGGVIGLWTFLMGLGSITAPILSGWIADSSGTLKGAFVLAAAAGLISLMLLATMLRAPQVSKNTPQSV